MPRPTRKELIQKLQTARNNRLLITYITSTRQNQEIAIADDAFRLIYNHLESGIELAKSGVDLYLHSNGGSGTVPWRIVSLIRQYTDHVAVLVPHHAFSAATLIALGANEIVMHKMGCLGPIDPSVANPFNPTHPTNPQQSIPISVEDVTAYFKLVKDEVGISHEDELVQALIALTEKIHPLAIGNVQRSHHQSRMLARKLLRLHMVSESQEHEIELLIDNLKSNLFYHGHPINRQEAIKDLKLKVVSPEKDVEGLMWDLYLEYETDLQMTEPFNPVRELELNAGATPPQQVVTTQQIVQQIVAMAQQGLGLGGVNEQQLVKLAVAMLPFTSGQAPVQQKVTLNPIPGAYIESVERCDVFKTDLRLEKVTVATPGGPRRPSSRRYYGKDGKPSNDGEGNNKRPATRSCGPQLQRPCARVR